MQKVQFYFDFLSPYSYFGWINHRKHLAQADFELEYRPVLMGKLFSHFEFRGPGEITVKRDSELKTCFRYAFKNSIPFHPPASFPFNPLGIIRAATLFAAKEKQVEVIDCLFKAVWAGGLVLEDPELIEEVLIKNNLGREICERSFERESKNELKTNIKQALSLNVFGVPSFVVGAEVFWGNDSLVYLSDYLSGNDNWDRKLYSRLIEKKK